MYSFKALTTREGISCWEGGKLENRKFGMKNEGYHQLGLGQKSKLLYSKR
jgi:hypothetical protein